MSVPSFRNLVHMQNQACMIPHLELPRCGKVLNLKVKTGSATLVYKERNGAPQMGVNMESEQCRRPFKATGE